MSDIPLIYCNGDSYSNEKYHPTLNGKAYANVVSEYFNGFLINNSINGSCNRRIIRTSVHDLVQQRQLNPKQRIVALIGLSFELRSEVWVDTATTKLEQESNFQTHTFADKEGWRDLLLNGKNMLDKGNKFLDNYNQSRAYYYSPYAERANLLCDCVMFQALMKELNIEFLMFQSPRAEQLKNEYLVDFFKLQLDNNCFIDFESFGFVDWCYEQGFVPLDFLDRPNIGHPTAQAHRAFAEQIVIPYFKKS
jgi:hypothetical protein